MKSGATPPHNSEVEAALIGAILSNNRVFAQVSGFLEPNLFYEPVHGWLFMPLAEWIDAGKKASPLSLKHYADREALLKPVGGGRYLYELVTAVVSVVEGRDYGATIHGLWRDRRALEVYNHARCALVAGGAYTQTTAERIEGVIETLSLLVETDGDDTGARPFARVAAETLAEIDRDRAGDSPVGVVSGFADLDQIVTALMPGDLTLLGARPGMGKTAFAGNVALAAAQRGEAVYFASLEMRDRQLARRHMGNLANIATHQLTGRRAKELRQRDIEARQVVVRESEARRKGSRNDEVGDISGGLKNMAKQLDVPVLALSQLSHRVQERSDKRTMLYDLRDSGSLEQDADNVLFLYREQYYLDREKENDGTPAAWEWTQERLAKVRDTAEIIVAKQRQGPIGTATLYWNGELQCFGNFVG